MKKKIIFDVIKNHCYHKNFNNCRYFILENECICDKCPIIKELEKVENYES